MSIITKKSDTHEERFVHLDIAGSDRVYKATVFARKEPTGWYAAVAFCAHGDQFEKHVGRSTARRAYFQKAGTRRFALYGAEYSFEMAVVAARDAIWRLFGERGNIATSPF